MTSLSSEGSGGVRPSFIAALVGVWVFVFLGGADVPPPTIPRGVAIGCALFFAVFYAWFAYTMAASRSAPTETRGET